MQGFGFVFALTIDKQRSLNYCLNEEAVMNSIYKYFLLFCFAVFFLGCRSGKQDTVGVSARNGGDAKKTAQQNDQKAETATVDISQMSPEKKAVYITQAEQIKTLNVGLKTAQRLFDQVWVCLWYAKKNADDTLGECPSVSQLQTVENVFHYSQNLISNIYATNGLPFINRLNKDDCSKNSYRDVLGLSGTNEYVLRRRQCVVSGKSPLLKSPVKKQNAQNGKQKVERIKANSENRSVDQNTDQKSGSEQDSVANVVSADLFKWSVKSNNEFELTFYVENMQEAAGLNLSFSGKNTVCSFKYKDAKTLLSLNCKNVGQNKNGNDYLLLENFMYNLQQEIAVQLNGQISSWDGQDYKTDVIQSMTVPVQGEALLEIERAPVELPENGAPLGSDLNNKVDQKDQSHQDGPIDPNNPKNPKLQSNQNDQSQKDQNEQNNKTEEKTDPRSDVNPNENMTPATNGSSSGHQDDSSAAKSSEQSADSLNGRSANPTTNSQDQIHETTGNPEQSPADEESQSRAFQQSVT